MWLARFSGLTEKRDAPLITDKLGKHLRSGPSARL